MNLDLLSDPESVESLQVAVNMPPSTELIERFVETAFLGELDAENIIRAWSSVGQEDDFADMLKASGVIPQDVDISTLKDFYGEEAYDSFLREKIDLYGLLRNGRLTAQQASGLIGGGNIGDPIPSSGIPKIDTLITPLIMHARQFRNKLHKTRLTHNILMDGVGFTQGSFAENRALRYQSFVKQVKYFLAAGAVGGMATTELGKSIARGLETTQGMARDTLRSIVGDELMKAFNLPAEASNMVIDFINQMPEDVYNKMWGVFADEAVYKGYSGEEGLGVIIEDVTEQFARDVVDPVRLQIEYGGMVPEDRAPNWYEPSTAGRNGLDEEIIFAPPPSQYAGNKLPEPLSGPGVNVSNAEVPPKRGRGRPKRKPGDAPTLPPREDLGERGPGRPPTKKEKGKQPAEEQDEPITGEYPAGDSVPGPSTAPGAPNAGEEAERERLRASKQSRKVLRILTKLKGKINKYVEDHIEAGKKEKPAGLDERLANTLFTYYEMGQQDLGLEGKIKQLALAQNYYKNKTAFDRNALRKKIRGQQKQPFSYPVINQSQYF